MFALPVAVRRHLAFANRALVSRCLRPLSAAKVAKLTVSLVGRPNTGKSTLFNRLTGSRSAIVSNVPGTTRDRKEGHGALAGLSFKVYDTGGFDDRGVVSGDIQKQVQFALQHSNIVLFMVDTKVGVTTLDEQFARWIRLQMGKNRLPHELPQVILVANKAEGGHMADSVLSIMSESFQLGFGEPVLISAVHGDGLADLSMKLVDYAQTHGYDDNGLKVKSVIPQVTESGDIPFVLDDVVEGADVGEANAPGIVHLAVMGRPNVGKSTLLNAIVGEERVLAGPLPGLTRDAITIEWNFRGRPFRLVDTAGLTRISTNKTLLEGVKEKRLRPLHESIGIQAAHDTVTLPGLSMVNTEEDPSQYSSQISEFALLQALNALRFAQVVMLVVEGAQGQFMKIDLQLARKCLQEGRGLFIVANKYDLVNNQGVTVSEYEKQVKEHCDEYLREFGDIPIVVTTGTENYGITRVLRTATEVHDAWSRRISTFVLNNWLRDTMVSVPTARAGDKAVKIKYMTQVKARPPTFTLFANASEIPGSFERFLRSRLQSDFHLKGVPIRFVVKKSVGNPTKLHLLRHGKHSRRGAGLGDSKGRVGPNRDRTRLLKRIRGSVLNRRKLDKRANRK